MRDYWVTVCAECERAICWHGILLCDKAYEADIKEMKASELDKLGLEHSGNYGIGVLLAHCGQINWVE